MGGAIPFILTAIITKNPELLAAGVAEGASEEAASDAILEVNKTLDELEKVKEIPAAEVDENHYVYHTVTNPAAGQSVLDGIDIKRLNPESRFGRGLYLSKDPDTTIAELEHHNAVGKYTIKFIFNEDRAKILDLTNPEIANIWKYSGGDISKYTKEIGFRTKEEGFNIVQFLSERSSGINLVVLKDFDSILKPIMIVPS